MAIGNQIRKYRTHLGMTLEQLSDASGVDIGTISALENRDSARTKYAVAIAEAMGVTVEQLENRPPEFLAELQIPEKENAQGKPPAHTHPRKLVERLCNIAEGINDLGLMYLIGKAEEIMKQHPHDDGAAKQTRAA